MAARDNPVNAPANRLLLLTRVFDAPRGVVFGAWIEPEHLMRWWGPHGFKVLLCEMDVRVGGNWRVCMRGPDGHEDRQRLVYREIVEPERIVFDYAFEDATGKTGHETQITVTFEEFGDKTRLTLHQAVFETVAVRDDHIRGWTEALDHLAEYAKKVAS